VATLETHHCRLMKGPNNILLNEILQSSAEQVKSRERQTAEGPELPDVMENFLCNVEVISLRLQCQSDFLGIIIPEVQNDD
jgi:hypothetical protein